jgi:hypothetical protein
VTKLVGADSGRKPLLRADSAFYGAAVVGAAIRAGADVSLTVRGCQVVCVSGQSREGV